MTECLQQKKWVKVCTWLIIWWTKVWKLVLCRAPLQLPSRFSCVDPSTPSQHHQPNNFKNIFQFSKNLAIFKYISKYLPPPLTTMNPIIVKISFNCPNIVNFSKYLALFKISSTSSQHHQPNNFQNIFQFSKYLAIFKYIWKYLPPPLTTMNPIIVKYLSIVQISLNFQNILHFSKIFQNIFHLRSTPSTE